MVKPTLLTVFAALGFLATSQASKCKPKTCPTPTCYGASCFGCLNDDPNSFCCPNTDLSGDPLVVPPFAQPGGVLCIYLDKTFCTYLSDGTLIPAEDGSNCRPTAVAQPSCVNNPPDYTPPVIMCQAPPPGLSHSG